VNGAQIGTTNFCRNMKHYEHLTGNTLSNHNFRLAQLFYVGCVHNFSGITNSGSAKYIMLFLVRVYKHAN